MPPLPRIFNLCRPDFLLFSGGRRNLARRFFGTFVLCFCPFVTDILSCFFKEIRNIAFAQTKSFKYFYHCFICSIRIVSRKHYIFPAGIGPAQYC